MNNEVDLTHPPNMRVETTMKKAKKRAGRAPAAPGTQRDVVVGDVTLGTTRRPPGSSRTSAGRLGTSLAATNKKTSKRTTKESKPGAKAQASRAKTPAQERSEGGLAKKSRATTTAAPKRSAKSPATKAGSKAEPAPSPAPPDLARKGRTDARVKGSRIRKAGIESRVLGHVSASGKRNQARRDSKNG